MSSRGAVLPHVPFLPVRIEKEHPRLKGWVATNEKTGEEVHIVSAQKLRGEWNEDATSSPEAGETQDGELTPEEGDEEAATDRTVAHESPMSGVDAAAKVLAEADEPLRVKENYRRAEEVGYWRSDAKTPDRTLREGRLRAAYREVLTLGPLSSSGLPGRSFLFGR